MTLINITRCDACDKEINEFNNWEECSYCGSGHIESRGDICCQGCEPCVFCLSYGDPFDICPDCGGCEDCCQCGS